MLDILKKHLTFALIAIITLLINSFILNKFYFSLLIIVNIFYIFYINTYVKRFIARTIYYASDTITFENVKYFNLFYINDVVFKHTKLKKIDYLHYITIPFFSALFFNAIFYNIFFNLSKLRELLLALIVNIIILLLLKNDEFINLARIAVSIKKHLLVLEGSKIIDFENIQGLISSHWEIYQHEKTYENYELKSLKRQRILLEGKLEALKKPSFFDSYILPIIFLITGGYITLSNNIVNKIIILENGNFDLNETVLSFIYLISVPLILIIPMLIANTITREKISDVKIRLQVVEELIESKKDEN